MNNPIDEIVDNIEFTPDKVVKPDNHELDEIKTKIKNHQISEVYCEFPLDDKKMMFPMRIRETYFDYFYVHISRDKVMRFDYEDYKIKFWLKKDKSE